jgi:hypothetical protein
MLVGRGPVNAAVLSNNFMTETKYAECPYCNSFLASDKAKQCLACGWDWHDPSNPVKRGTPNWNRFGVDETASYTVDLCQRSNGDRYYEYNPRESEVPNPECVRKTEPMSGIDLLVWLQSGREQHLTLTTREQFLFDAHGIWLLYSEVQRMRDRKNPWWMGDQSFSVNGLTPRFPEA